MSIEKLVEFSRDGEKNTDGLDLVKGFPSKLQPARQWFNWIFNNLTLKMNEVIDEIQKNSDVGIGKISLYAVEAIPSDSLELNGSIKNIIDYPKLFKVLGKKYGGDGITTFGLPDYRGLFVRAWDNGKGIDNERALGSAQEDELKSHTHEYLQVSGGGEGQTSGGSSTYNRPTQTESTGGSETRPKNISAVYVIKAK